MKKTFKKLMAFAMVAVMMANPMSALAAENTTSPAQGSANASGDVEGFVDTSIFKVVLPTSAEGTFDFIMAPQGLIAATSGNAYTGATFGEGNVFFNTASANASGDYKNQSNFIEVLNRGTVDVNVTVEATINGLSNIAMAASSDFASGDAAVPELYLAFTASGDASGDAKNANVALTENGATIKAVLAAADEDKYTFGYASGEYTYDLKAEYASGDASVFDNYKFALTGACNPYADWSDVKEAAPTVKVVWTLEDAEAGPQIAATSAGLITVSNMTAEANFKSATISNATATVDLTQYSTNDAATAGTWSASTGGTIKFQLKNDIMTAWTGQNATIKITLSDGSTIQTSVTLD